MGNKKPKSFRLDENDVLKLKLIHEYYKNDYRQQMENANMSNLHRWSEAQTLAVLIRNEFIKLNEDGHIEN